MDWIKEKPLRAYKDICKGDWVGVMLSTKVHTDIPISDEYWLVSPTPHEHEAFGKTIANCKQGSFLSHSMVMFKHHHILRPFRDWGSDITSGTELTYAEIANELGIDLGEFVKSLNLESSDNRRSVIFEKGDYYIFRYYLATESEQSKFELMRVD